MRVLVISDSHGINENVEAVINQVGTMDLILHLGDVGRGVDYLEAIAPCPIYFVAGNNDYNLDLPAERLITVEGYRIFMTHGHRFYVGSTTEYLERYAKEHSVDIVMYGHTHVPYIDIGSDVTILNPGSISLPRQEGFQKTFLLMEINEDKEIHYAHGILG